MALRKKGKRAVWRDQLHAFGEELEEALRSRGMSHAMLASTLGVAKSTVFTWRSGLSEAPYDLVFEMEQELQLPPGYLSHHLGYLPVESDYVPVQVGRRGPVRDPLADFEDFLATDDLLGDDDRARLVLLYRKLVWEGRRIGPTSGDAVVHADGLD